MMNKNIINERHPLYFILDTFLHTLFVYTLYFIAQIPICFILQSLDDNFYTELQKLQFACVENVGTKPDKNVLPIFISGPLWGVEAGAPAFCISKDGDG